MYYFSIPTAFPSFEEHDQSPLDKFKSYLKHVYKHKLHATYFEESSLRHYEPFNLFKYFVCDPENLYDWSSDSGNLREDEESISLRLHNYEPGSKSKLELSKISITNKSGNIFIEGAPGVGKSAFAWEMCRNWASEGLLQKCSIVVLINLCNQHVREAKILSEFLFYPDQKVTEKICQDLIHCNGKRTIFIVDGLDEQQLPPHGSVYQQLADKELLPSATLMILSKVSCRKQRKYTHQHIQVSGFTKESIDLYITSACSNNIELLAAFKSYISSHPFIYNLMHIPAQCVMITDLYRLHWNHGDKGFSPSTLTELYTELVRTLLLRYLSCHHEYSQMKWIIEEFTDLPDKAHESFMALAHLAAKGIEKRKYVFNVPKDFEILGLKTVEDFETFGLMQRVDEVYPGRKSSESYSFLHLTLQEYMAAYYCSQQAPVERLQKVLISPFPLEQFLSCYCYRLTFFNRYPLGCLHRTVLLFTVGLTKLDWDDQKFLKLLRTFTILLSAMHLLYETQSPTLIQRTFSLLNHDTPARRTEKYGLLDIPSTFFPLDLFVTGYCIPHSNRSWLLHTSNEDFKRSRYVLKPLL